MTERTTGFLFAAITVAFGAFCIYGACLSRLPPNASEIAVFQSFLGR